jgi:peptide/nickel transport system substrate-binding protein
MIRRVITLLAATIIMSLLLAACAAPATQPGTVSETEAPSAADPQTAGQPDASADISELVLAVTNEPTSYMPGFVGWNDVNSVGSRNIFEFLVTRHPETHELAGELATSWERIDDQTWRFHLRQGVTFHDGSPFNAEVAAYSINYLFNADNEPNATGHMASQITAEVVDEYTIDVLTEAPDPIIPTRLFFVAMAPIHVLEEGQEPYARDPIGTGPYKLAEWRSGQFVRMEANPDWWGHDDPDAALGTVTYPSAVFYFRPETTVRQAMVEAGEADFAMNISADMCAELAATPNARCISAPGISTIFVRLDALHPFMGDQRVREAILMAVDMDLILDTILKGTATRAVQIVGPAATGYNPDIQAYPYDPARARELLAEAAADGVQMETIELAFQEARFPAVSEFAQAMQAMLQDVGLDATVLEMERSAFQGQFGPGEYPANRIVIHTHGNASGDAEVSISFYLQCDGSGSWVCDPELDRMFAEAVTKDGDERAQAFADIFAYAHEKAYLGYGGHIDFSYGLSNRLDWTLPADHRLLLKNMGLNE